MCLETLCKWLIALCVAVMLSFISQYAVAQQSPMPEKHIGVEQQTWRKGDTVFYSVWCPTEKAIYAFVAQEVEHRMRSGCKQTRPGILVGARLVRFIDGPYNVQGRLVSLWEVKDQITILASQAMVVMAKDKQVMAFIFMLDDAGRHEVAQAN